MSSTAWVFQKGEDLDKMGAEKASWYVGWYEPDGTRKKKSFGPGFRGKKEAERYKNKVENDLMAGTYQMTPLKQWADFRQEYERRIVPRLAARSREPVKTALDHFIEPPPAPRRKQLPASDAPITTFLPNCAPLVTMRCSEV